MDDNAVVRPFNHDQNHKKNNSITDKHLPPKKKPINPFESHLSLFTIVLMNIMFFSVCCCLMYCFIFKDRYRRDYYVTEVVDEEYNNETMDYDDGGDLQGVTNVDMGGLKLESNR